MWIEGNSFEEGIYRRVHPCIFGKSFIGIWEVPGKDLLPASVALSLERRGSGYYLGGPIGYLQEIIVCWRNLCIELD